jgi:predicted NBD/HSP70 family sugar kinase
MSRVLDLVQVAGPLTQAEISRRTGLSAASVTNIVRLLTDEGGVDVADAVQAGRRCRVVTPTCPPGLVLGIDIGRTHLRMCIADRAKTVLAEGSTDVAPGVSAEDGLGMCADLFATLLADNGLARDDVLVAAAGVPGPLDHQTGQIGAGSLLPEWNGIDLPERFSDALGLNVLVENDANLGALGEYLWDGIHTPRSSLIYLRLATGIGGGMVLDGHLHRGLSGTAGELGHMTIDENGRLCRCGNRGCLETLAATPVMLDVLASALERRVDLDTWLSMAAEGHTASVRLLEDMARHLGAVVANLCNLINPEVVCLGGPVTAAGDLLLAPMRDEVQRRAIPSASRRVRLEMSKHGPRSEVYGAVCLAIRSLTSGAEPAFTS